MYRFEARKFKAMKAEESELVLNPDGSVYHLSLKPEHIADNVILVGDPGRVAMITARFEHIEHRIEHREFVTQTGYFNGKRITVLATGIGTDNIDIVVNELDAAVNYDLATRTVKTDLRRLNLIRIGTCGGLHPEIQADKAVISRYSIGLDGVAHFYSLQPTETELALKKEFEEFTSNWSPANMPYATAASDALLQLFNGIGKQGITLTANGFFGPQGRQLRIPLARPGFNDTIHNFEYDGYPVLNYEMESSALYALGHALGHACICICLVVANRKAGSFSTNYKASMEQLIDNVLIRLTEA
jgi:uridine phosphorylase